MENPDLGPKPKILYLLDSAHRVDVLKGLETRQQRRQPKGNRWCCAVCGSFITDEASIVPINGQIEHYKVNPNGHAFRFRSYKQADGCTRVGLATSEFSWYSGYLWQFSHCLSCRTQLGWYFSGHDSFFGLINEQLVSCQEQKDL